MFDIVLLDLLVIIFGLCIGSFLNVVIYRLEKGEGFVKGRSYCPHCKHPLIWLDLIPLVSFLCLQGKCRYCKANISWQYPLVELSTALIFLLIFNFQFNAFSILQYINLAVLFYIASSLIIIFVYDLKYYVIPDSVLFPAIIIAVVYRLTSLSLIGNYLLAVCVASGFFLVLFLVSEGTWMGFGDVKLAILLGLLLGMPKILAGLFLAFGFGAIIGIGLLFWNKKGLKSQVPFAPFLIIGTLVAFFWAPEIINWYSHVLIF